MGTGPGASPSPAALRPKLSTRRTLRTQQVFRARSASTYGEVRWAPPASDAQDGLQQLKDRIAARSVCALHRSLYCNKIACKRARFAFSKEAQLAGFEGTFLLRLARACAADRPSRPPPTTATSYALRAGGGGAPARTAPVVAAGALTVAIRATAAARNCTMHLWSLRAEIVSKWVSLRRQPGMSMPACLMPACLMPAWHASCRLSHAQLQ